MKMATILVEHADRYLIGGEWVAPSGKGLIDVTMPSMEELFLNVAEAEEADVERAAAAARAAFDTWP